MCSDSGEKKLDSGTESRFLGWSEQGAGAIAEAIK